MTRIALFTALLTGVLSAASRAESEAIPPPREIRADGSRDPAPEPDPNTLTAKAAKFESVTVAKSENPAETVEKIIKNSKTITDRLADSDTGKDTRKTQDETLALIDSLLNPPPPPPSGGGSDDKKDNKDKSDDKKDMKGMDDMPPPKKGMDPMDGMDQQPKDKDGRRPRMNPGDQPEGKEPKDKGMNPMGKMPMPMMDPGGMNPSGGVPMGVAGVRPSLPLDDEVTKEVWGHLPDKLRQQVTQYYKEQFMPKYSELLKQYYSSLANQNPKPLELKK